MSEQHGYQLDLADVNGPLSRASCSCGAWSHPLAGGPRAVRDRSGCAGGVHAACARRRNYPDGTEVGRAPSRRACCDQPSRPASPVAAARHGRTGEPVARCPVPPSGARRQTSDGTSLRSASTRRSTRWSRSSPAGWLRTTPSRSSPTASATCSTGSPPTPALQSRSAERRQGLWLDQLVRRMPRTPRLHPGVSTT